jgi:hypothetical protein
MRTGKVSIYDVNFCRLAFKLEECEADKQLE